MYHESFQHLSLCAGDGTVPPFPFPTRVVPSGPHLFFTLSPPKPSSAGPVRWQSFPLWIPLGFFADHIISCVFMCPPSCKLLQGKGHVLRLHLQCPASSSSSNHFRTKVERMGSIMDWTMYQVEKTGLESHFRLYKHREPGHISSSLWASISAYLTMKGAEDISQVLNLMLYEWLQWLDWETISALQSPLPCYNLEGE